ncbi:hypothetical protein Tco_0261952 [Tanacetum coccineum]
MNDIPFSTVILKSISSLRELTVGSHESSASDVNVSLKTIVGNSVSTDPSSIRDDTNATKEKQAKERSLIHFRILHTLFEDLSKEDLANSCFSSRFKRAFLTFFREDVEYFAPRTLLKDHGTKERMTESLVVTESSGIKSEKQDESSRTGNDTHAEDGKINKDALEIDNKVAGASHDKDNITEVQSSNNKMFENVFAHDHGQKHVDEKTKMDNKTLKEENVLLKKETETYKERVRDFEKKPVQFMNYKSAYDNLQKQISVEQQNNEKLQKEKDEIRDLCFLGQTVACNPKLYDAHVLRQEFMKLDVHDTREIPNDAEEKSSTSYVTPESSPQNSNLPSKRMPNESQLLKLFVNLDNKINELGKLINIHQYIDRDRSFIYDNKADIRRIFIGEIVQISKTLNKCSKEIKQEITAEVKEMLDILESMESEVDETSKKHEILQNMIDQLLEANIANDVRDLVMQSYMELRKEKKLKENEHLKLVYKNLFDSIKRARVQTKKSNVTQNEEENLRSKLFEFADEKFDHILGKVDSSPSSIGESNISEFEKESREKKNLCENAKCELQTKIVELEKVLIQQTKDFDDVKLELSNRMTKFEAYFEKLENTKVFLVTPPFLQYSSER